MSSFAWDVFVSHNRVNKPWVRRFVRQWRDLGVQVFFDEDSINPGEDVIAGIERGLAGSRHVVLFLSPASISSRWVALETSITLYSDPDAMGRRLIPVALSPIDSKLLRPSIARLNRIDLTDPFSRLDQYKHLCRFLNISDTATLPSDANEIYVSISSLGTADPLALKITLYAIRALADIGPVIKAFGTHDNLDPGVCLDRISAASAHMVVFPDRASRASDESVARATAEYVEARRKNVDVLAYVPPNYRMISGLPLRRLFEDITNCQPVVHVESVNVKSRFGDIWHEDFGRQIARDLDRIAQSSLDSDSLEANAPLAALHERVLDHLYAVNLEAADQGNKRILATYADSPRAHYNQACIYSWRGERDTEAKEELLLRAKRHFERAIELGIVCLITLRGEGAVCPDRVIAANPALQALFGRYPELLKTIDNNSFFGPRRLGGGCIYAEVLISLADGRRVRSLELKVGERVMSWNALRGEITDGSVCRRVSHVVPELLVINNSLKVTPSHPVLVNNEWKSAGSIIVGDLLHLATGRTEEVVTIDRLSGRFAVLNFSVEPYSSFVAAGVLVHNK